MKNQNYILIGLIGLFIMFNRKKINESVIDVKNTITNFLYKDTYKSIKEKYIETIKKVLTKYGIDLNINEVLTTIYKESGSLSLSKDNKDILGDLSFKYKAYGIMQVRYPALMDVNKYFQTDFTEQDLKKLEVNIFAGSGYLYLCKLKAKKESSNYLGLMYQKYNAGINTKKESDNGKNYSVKSIEILENFSNLA